MKQKQPLLTIGMIVKNESRCLERCLKALQPLRDAIPCELIIADTGSTDNTREIAERYADLVFDFPWIKDFSAARNAVVERASGLWYFSIDADEYLDADISQLVVFLTGSQSRKIDLAGVVVRNYFNPDMLGDYTDGLLLRMMRMETGLRYTGSIHETLDTHPGMSWVELESVVLHHDGYALASEEASEEKTRRNMELLVQELEKNPEDLHRMMQCLESSTTLPEQGSDFARRGMALIMGNRALPRWAKDAPPIARTAIHAAYRYELPELEEWVCWTKENFPDSPYTTIDTTYFYILWLYQRERYEEAAKEIAGYVKAMDKYRTAEYSSVLYSISALRCVSQNNEHIVLELGAECALWFGQKAQALAYLQKVSFHQAKPQSAVRWLTSLEKLGEEPEAQKLLVRQFPALMDDSDGSDRSRVRKEASLQKIAAAFLPGQMVEGWRLYVGLDNALGAAARCMAAETAGEAYAALYQVDQWGAVPQPALARTIVLGAALPDSFYDQKPETLREIAVSLAQYEKDWLDALLNWNDTEQTLKQLQFRFELLASALRDVRIPNYDRRLELVLKFVSLSRTYLNRLYHPDVLQGEDWTSLSGLHRGARLLVLAVTALERQKWAESIRILRTALAEAPALKFAVDILLGEVQQREREERIHIASPELMNLANQIRLILSRYAPGDPIVTQLKATAQYQKVAWLLESAAEVQ